jgi:hypothetical protein
LEGRYPVKDSALVKYPVIVAARYRLAAAFVRAAFSVMLVETSMAANVISALWWPFAVIVQIPLRKQVK